MLAKTKKYLITTSKREILTIRQKELMLLRFCPQCVREAEMLSLDAATSKTGRSTRELFSLIENNLLHSIETESGHLLICQNSLEAIKANF